MRSKTPSVVWQFFDRVMENKRCVAVTCKLCDSQYKFFGNTTNLRVHLSHKHPIQWDLVQNGSLDASTIRVIEDEESSRSRRGRRLTNNYRVNQNVDEQDNSDNDQVADEDANASIHLIKQMADGEEEWLEENFTYESKPKRRKSYKKIKKELDDTSRSLPSYILEETPFKKPEQVIVRSQNKDEYSVFGEYIANKLRKLNEPRTRSNLQQLITTVLWQAEYGMYAETESVKRILLNCFQETPEVRTVQEEEVTIET